MKRFTLSLAAVLTFIPAMHAGDWKKVESNKGGFSVQFPGPATYLNKKEKTFIGELELHMWMCQLPNGGGMAMVVYTDLPAEDMESIDDLDTTKFALEGVVKGFATNIKGKVLRQKWTKLDGHTGIDADIEILGGRTLIRYRAYVANNRIYQVMVYMPKADADRKTADRVLGSFQLLVDD